MAFENESFIDSELNVNESIVSQLNNEEQMGSDLGAVEQTASELNSSSPIDSLLDEPLVHRYEAESSDNIDVVINNNDYTIFASLKQIRFPTFNDFPKVGSDRLIYISNDDKVLYGWDDSSGYFKLSAGETGGGESYDDTQIRKDIKNLQDNKADKSEIPDVSAFITKTVNNLVNYYTKSETYTKEEVNAKISVIPKFNIEIVDSLPTTNISTTTIYLLPLGSQNRNLYYEYIYVNGSWEELGLQTVDLTKYVTYDDMQSAINGKLTQYYTKKETDNLLSNYATTQDLNYKVSVALAEYYTKVETDEKLSTKQDKISSTNMIKSDLIDDNAQTHKFVTAEEKEIWNNKSNFSGDYNDLTNKPTMPVLPDTSNFVTTNTEQTITALKTFKQGNSTNYVALGVDIDNTPALQVGFDGFGRFQKFQDKSGTIALTSDIPTSVGIKLRRWS